MAMRDFAPELGMLADILLPTFDDEKAGFGDASPAETVERLTGRPADAVKIAQAVAARVVLERGALAPTDVLRQAGLP
jgi:hypothetical protein